MIRKGLFLGAAVLLLGAPAAYAAFPPIDLATTAGTNVLAADGTYWQQLVQAPTGTGTYDPFLRTQANDTEEAFNTDYRSGGGGGQAPLDALNDPNYTRSFQLGSLQIVNQDVGNGMLGYYEFTLDINEPNNDPSWFLSLDELQIYTVAEATGGSLSSLADVQANGDLKYDLDGAGDQTVYMNHSLTEGSGHDDVRVYIPVSYFSGASATDYVYFYNKFGEAGATYDGVESGDGFEEWKALFGENPPPPDDLPEPSTVMLLGTGLLGLAASRIRRK